ncbi:MAG: hypothetical protein IPN11_14280 [Opitutaceae bacterium]|nr:hypothetical protein [Opitutaceae bacterium]
MHSKNKKPMTEAERRHVTRVKLLPCGVCGEGGGDLAPSEAHEIEQGQWFTSIGLCADCHRGAINGLHSQQRIWKVLKLTELRVLNETIRRLYG